MSFADWLAGEMKEYGKIDRSTASRVSMA